MKKRFFGPIILAFILFAGAIAIPSSWLTGFITDKRVKESATALNPSMFQGLYLQDQMLKDPTYLPIYGSSELSRLDEFHPSNYFQVNNEGFTPYLVGKGGSQSLIHSLNFAAHMDQLKGKKSYSSCLRNGLLSAGLMNSISRRTILRCKGLIWHLTIRSTLKLKRK